MKATKPENGEYVTNRLDLDSLARILTDPISPNTSRALCAKVHVIDFRDLLVLAY